MLAALKRWDIYRDVPKDLTEQTITGAIVSVLCAVLVLFLFLSEFVAFLSVEVVSEMYVDAVSRATRQASSLGQLVARWCCVQLLLSCCAGLRSWCVQDIDHHNH